MPSESASPARSWLLLNPEQPIKSLTILFGLWKAFVFLVVVCSPGPGYDTSTGLLPYLNPATPDIQQAEFHAPLSSLLKFVRWDSIYFVHTAEYGYIYEQEWAFGYGYSQTLSFLTSALPQLHGLGGVTAITIIAVTLSHLAHFLSVLALYRLSANVFGQDTSTRKLVCFLSAALHIICPAGAFLSAPYGEALFSFLNITGFYIYSSSFLDNSDGRRLSSDVKLLLASVFFSAATTVRSNGILSGIPYAYDAIALAYRILNQGLSTDACVRLCVTIIGGSVIAVGIIFPQFLAYTHFCLDVPSPRPWCAKLIPGIYGYVQAHYWNVGFLRYWTVSNLPLFLLALPMLFILCRSSLWALNRAAGSFSYKADGSTSSMVAASLLTRLAIPQGILAVLAFTSYHVQIINRICSGYPLWYWYLVYQILGDPAGPSGANKRRWGVTVQAMIIYALVQAILFGSFLPPA